jgi:hypothetical protein
MAKPFQVPAEGLFPLVQLPFLAGLGFDLVNPKCTGGFPSGFQLLGDAPVLKPGEEDFEAGAAGVGHVAGHLEVHAPGRRSRMIAHVSTVQKATGLASGF